MCTVQAPHIAMPQPNLVPVSCKVSRSTHSNGVSAATSTRISWSLMFSVIMRISGVKVVRLGQWDLAAYMSCPMAIATKAKPGTWVSLHRPHRRG
ncbi:hypothetical protein D9M68_793770 [compost metagenome]